MRAKAQADYVKTALRVPPEIHAQLHAERMRSGRTFNAEIIYRLTESFRTTPPMRAIVTQPAATPVAWRFKFSNEGFTHPALRKMRNEWIDVESSGMPTAEDLELAPCEFAYLADSLSNARTGIDTAELAARIAEWIGQGQEQRS